MSNEQSTTLANNMYSMLADKLLQINATISVAEIHGILSGLACQGVGENDISQYSDMVELHDADGKLIMEGLYSLILRDLNADDSSFKVLLPDDEQSTQARIESTADWASGFVQGILQNNEHILQTCSQTTRECIEDVLQISQLNSDISNLENDVNSADFQLTEIEEYLRVNVQLMYLENQQQFSQPSTSNTQH